MRKKSNKIRFLSIIFKQNRKISIIALFIMIVTAILDLLIPQITEKILDEAIPHKSVKLLLEFIVLYVLISVINPLLQMILSYIYAKIKKKVGITLKLSMLKHISKLSGYYYSNIKTGNVMSIIESDVNVLESFGIDLIFSLFVDTGTALFALYFLLHLDQDLLIIVLVLQSIILIVQAKLTKIIANRITEIREKSGVISNIVQEYISNIMNVVISRSILYFFKNYIKKEKELIKKCISLEFLYSGNMSVGSFLTSMITIVIYGYGGFKIIKGNMSLGELIAFQQYTWRLVGPCVNIIRSNTKIQQSAVSVDRIFKILDEPIDIKQNNNARKSDYDSMDDIVFDRVTFSYSDEKILDEINMIFKNGKTTALVGASGCGKSTIVNLLYRLWDVDSGQILLDDIDISKYNLKSIRKNICIITQDILLFDDSILNNLVLGNKVIQMCEVINICRDVGIYDFIQELPNGFDTVIGEKGVKLSGGQKQRIAIARAILCSSNIIIMDEATSALDNISQMNILDNLNKYLNNKIIIVIAHRLSTIKNADTIYVIENGRVKEEGCHEELILNGGVYYNLINGYNETLRLSDIPPESHAVPLE